MPKTEHFGFPLMADTPPTGTTGKDLRNTILGEGSDSLSSMVDDALSSTASELTKQIPTKLSQLQNDAGYITAADIPEPDVTLPEDIERTDNKLSSYNGVDGGWFDISPEKYPSSQAVHGFVRDYVANNTATSDSFSFYLSRFIAPFLTVDIDRFDWDGDVDGHFGLMGTFFRISDSTSTDGTFKVNLSAKDSESGENTLQMSDLVAEPTITDLKDALGIVIYTVMSEPVLVIAERDGVLPAALIEQFAGVNPGADLPYEAGTYALCMDGSFISCVKRCLSVKDYIDKRLEELG